MMGSEGDAATPPITLHVVGVARGNPGLAGAGIVIINDDGVVTDRIATYLGNATTLEAQLQALVLALRHARPYRPAPLHLVLANDTAVRQLGGEMPARHPAILRVLEKLDELLDPFGGATLRLGEAEEIAEAENLANLGIDTRLRPLPAYHRPLPD